jgi:hypothetical protein
LWKSAMAAAPTRLPSEANFSWCMCHHANTISLLWPNKGIQSKKVFRSEGLDCTVAPLPCLEKVFRSEGLDCTVAPLPCLEYMCLRTQNHLYTIH